MKLCMTHWNMCRDSIEELGMSALVHKDGRSAIDSEVRQLEEHAKAGALSAQTGSNVSLTIDTEANPDNEGHFCPLCEWVKHAPEINASEAIDRVSTQMQAWCREQGLIPKAS